MRFEGLGMESNMGSDIDASGTWGFLVLVGDQCGYLNNVPFVVQT